VRVKACHMFPASTSHSEFQVTSQPTLQRESGCMGSKAIGWNGRLKMSGC
jgi:hypothetical protein